MTKAAHLAFVLIAAIALALSLGPPAAAESRFSVQAAAFSPKSNALLLVRGWVIDSYAELRVVDFSDPAKPAERRIASRAGAAAFLPDGRHVVTGGEDGAVRVVTLDGIAAGPPVHASGERIVVVAVSPSGRFLAAVDRTFRLRVWQSDGRGFRPRWQSVLDPKSSPLGIADLAFAPDESAIAVISNFGSVFLRTIEGRPIAVPLGPMSYESCCGVRIGFTGDGRFLIARRGYEPGWEAFVWSFRSGRLDGGAQFPGAQHVRDFSALPGKTAKLVILDNSGVRSVSLEDDEGMPRGLPSAVEVRTLVAADPAREIEFFAISADGDRLATKEISRDSERSSSDTALVYRDGAGALLGRIALR